MSFLPVDEAGCRTYRADAGMNPAPARSSDPCRPTVGRGRPVLPGRTSSRAPIASPRRTGGCRPVRGGSARG